MFVRLVFHLHLNRCCLWSLTEEAFAHRRALAVCPAHRFTSAAKKASDMCRGVCVTFSHQQTASLRLQRLKSGLKQACCPFPFHFTSITPNRGDQQRLNYVMLGLDLRPEMLPNQLPKCRLERFVINNFNYSSIANCFSMESLELFCHQFCGTFFGVLI